MCQFRDMRGHVGRAAGGWMDINMVENTVECVWEGCMRQVASGRERERKRMTIVQVLLNRS
jgi:hypothetical protein